MESATLKTRVAELRSLRRSIIAAARVGVRNLDAADQAALESSIEDRIEEALDDEIAPLIDGLEAEAACLSTTDDEDWTSGERAGRLARVLAS